MLDRTATADVGRAARVLAVSPASRRRAFRQRLLHASKRSTAIGRRAGAADLPLGVAPPQGGIVEPAAVVRFLAAPDGGFDERTGCAQACTSCPVDEWHLLGRRAGSSGGADRLRACSTRLCPRSRENGRRGPRSVGSETMRLRRSEAEFRRSGLYHLLASPQNVVLLPGILGSRGCSGCRGQPVSLCSPAIAAYVLAVGPQPSVIRAAVAGMRCPRVLSSRERTAALVLLAAVVLLVEPYALLIGFQLSFAAVVAIFVE